MHDVEALLETARGSDEPLTGQLRLGVIPTIAPFLLPPVLPRLRRGMISMSCTCSRNAPGSLPVSMKPR